MTTPAWQPGTLYPPGSLVQRRSVPAASPQVIANSSFESGVITGWTTSGDAGWTVELGGYTGGSYFARYKPSSDGIGVLYATSPAPCNPGQVIKARCMVTQGRAARGNAGGRVQLRWYNGAMLEIAVNDGNEINSSDGGNWKASNVTATAPAGAAFVAIGARVFQQESGRSLGVDAFQWDHTYAISDLGLVFRAVQAEAGYSGATEPTWPNTLGVQVIDNQVTWEAVDSAYVTWEAVPILKTGVTEPDWPEEVGASIDDGTVRWTAVSRRVEDENCPNTKAVIIAASKIFAEDDDIIAFSATTNPLDWTTRDDAGYLPYGLRQFGSNPVKAMALYRGNLAAFNAEGFQLWQVDEDPASMAILDAAPVGAVWPRAQQPVGNDLQLLGATGVRNLSLAAASANLQAGSTGEPIDPLVTAAVRAGTYEPHSATYPAHGQYWLIFGPQAFVFTSTSPGKGTWSRYVFPETITEATLLGEVLYLRAASGAVWELTEDEVADDVYCQGEAPVLIGADGYSLSVDLAWTYDYPEFEAETFRILRSMDGSLFVEIGYVAGDTFTYTDTTVQLGHEYEYAIVARPAIDEAIDSPMSNVLDVAFPEVAPPPVLSGAIIDSVAELEWTAAGATTGSTIVEYQVWRAISGGEYALIGTPDGATLEYSDSTISPNVTYWYYIVAISSEDATSANSNIVILTEALYTPTSWVNGDAEMGDMTGWTVTEGVFSTVNFPDNPSPGGEYMFYAGTAGTSKMNQWFDVSTTGIDNADIDAGDTTLVIDWWAGSFKQAPTLAENDLPKINVTFYSDVATGGSVLGSVTTGFVVPETEYPSAFGLQLWDAQHHEWAVPAGTRSIRIECHAEKNWGTSNDAKFDSIAPYLRVD